MTTSTNTHSITKGLWLGLLGIVIFSVTLPMTRLAVGTAAAPQMSGFFIAYGRAVVAGVLSAGLLVAPRGLNAPTGCHWPLPQPAWFLDFRYLPQWPCVMWKLCMPA